MVLVNEGLHVVVAVRYATTVNDEPTKEAQQCRLALDAEPYQRGKEETAKGRPKVGVDDVVTQLFHLISHPIDPSRRKGLAESKEQYGKVDVKVNSVQEDKTCIGRVDEAAQEAYDADGRDDDPPRDEGSGLRRLGVDVLGI